MGARPGEAEADTGRIVSATAEARVAVAVVKASRAAVRGKTGPIAAAGDETVRPVSVAGQRLIGQAGGRLIGVVPARRIEVTLGRPIVEVGAIASAGARLMGVAIVAPIGGTVGVARLVTVDGHATIGDAGLRPAAGSGKTARRVEKAVVTAMAVGPSRARAGGSGHSTETTVARDRSNGARETLVAVVATVDRIVVMAKGTTGGGRLSELRETSAGAAVRPVTAIAKDRRLTGLDNRSGRSIAEIVIPTPRVAGRETSVAGGRATTGAVVMAMDPAGNVGRRKVRDARAEIVNVVIVHTVIGLSVTGRSGNGKAVTVRAATVPTVIVHAASVLTASVPTVTVHETSVLAMTAPTASGVRIVAVMMKAANRRMSVSSSIPSSTITTNVNCRLACGRSSRG